MLKAKVATAIAITTIKSIEFRYNRIRRKKS